MKRPKQRNPYVQPAKERKAGYIKSKPELSDEEVIEEMTPSHDEGLLVCSDCSVQWHERVNLGPWRCTQCGRSYT